MATTNPYRLTPTLPCTRFSLYLPDGTFVGRLWRATGLPQNRIIWYYNCASHDSHPFPSRSQAARALYAHYLASATTIEGAK